MLQSDCPMSELVRTLVSFPTVPLTVAMGVVLLYWLLVVLGGFGLDGAGDGVAASAKVTGEALNSLKGVVGKEGIFEALGFGQVPVTVSVSLFVFISWALTWVGTTFFKPDLVMTQLMLLLGSLLLAVAGSVAVAMPVSKLFASPPTARRNDLVGRVCQVTSGRVDAGFGTAEVIDGGRAIAVHVVCGKDNTLVKGHKALVVAYDERRDVFEVEPLDFLEPSELEALDDPLRRHHVLAGRVKF